MAQLSLDMALIWCARLTSVSLLLCAIEYMSNPRILRDEGLMSWDLGRVRHPYLFSGFLGRIYDSVIRYPQILFWLGLEVALCVSILVGPASWAISAVPCLSIYFVMLLRQNRSGYGYDGADQMSSYVMLAIGISSLAPVTLSRLACVVFVAFQACLSYATAGWAKLPMAGWRDGSYLRDILKTRVYGTPRVGHFLGRHPLVSTLATRFVLLWECTFPIAPFLPLRMAYGYLLLGVLFHVGNAIFMGLNTFFWSFIATYPALIWVIQNVPAGWQEFGKTR